LRKGQGIRPARGRGPDGGALENDRRKEETFGYSNRGSYIGAWGGLSAVLAGAIQSKPYGFQKKRKKRKRAYRFGKGKFSRRGGESRVFKR